MTRVGRFGDTHVAPIIRPAVPPPAALDIQLRCPASLSALLEVSQADELNPWGHGYAALLTATATRVQRDGGYVDDGRGTWPARLELVPVDCPASTARHSHIYVWPTARALRSGDRWPVAVEELRESIYSVTWPFFAEQLRSLTTEVFDATWGPPRPGAAEEILEPPWHEAMGDGERGVCPGPWGPRRLILADERHLQLCARAERDLEQNESDGHAWSEPPLYEPASRPPSLQPHQLDR